MADLAGGAGGRVPGQLSVQGLFVAMQQESHLPAAQALQGERHRGGHDGRPMIAAHGVDRDHYGVRHGGAWAPQ